MERISRAVLLGLFLLCVVQVDGFSKYGRTCQDIGCRSNEICVMAEDPCDRYTRNECGRYPTCTSRGGGGLSCTNKVCPAGQYCKSENGQPTCVSTNSGNLGPAGRRPGGRYRPVVLKPMRPAPPPPPRSSSYGQGGRYSGGGFGNTIWNRGSSGSWDDKGRSGNRGQPINRYNGGGNHYQTHTSTDAQVDEYPPVLDIFAENNGGEFKEMFRRQNTGVDTESPSGGTKTSGTSGYPVGSGYPSSSAGGSSGYPAGSGYPSSSGTGNSGYPAGSGYPSSSSGGSSGYPSSGSAGGYPARNPSSYPSGSGYPSGSDTATKTSSTGVNSGYPTGSGYPSSSGSGYPSSSSSGHPSYPSGSGYPSSSGTGYPASSGYPSLSDGTARRTSATSVNSGYPTSGSSGSSYPSNSGYPSSGSSGSGYPSNAGYPSYGNSESTLRRSSVSSVNAGYPSSGGSYPSSNGGYPNSGSSGYPGGGYPTQNQGQSVQNNYPSQSNGYPASGGYPGQYGQYNNGGQQPYPGSYQQPSGPGNYNNQQYPNGYPSNPGGAYPPQKPKKPSITEQITNYAKNLAKQVLTQTIIDKVSGRN